MKKREKRKRHSHYIKKLIFNLLKQTNTRFYTEEGLNELAEHLIPGGVFALWADGEPDASFTDRLKQVFGWAEGHTIEFENPITESTSKGTVYLAKKSA